MPKFEHMAFIDECGNCGKKRHIYCTACFDCENCCPAQNGLEHLENLKVGDAFELEGKRYIAFSLTPDPAEVYCLNVGTKELEELDENEVVRILTHWGIWQDFVYNKARPEKDLEVL
jgi:hypothetical protein